MPLLMPNFRLSAAMIALVVASGCQIGGGPSSVEMEGDSAAVSFELAGAGGAAVVVPVYLNGGGPHAFVVDTGATFTCIHEPLADSLDLPEQTGGVGFGAGIGGSGRVRLVRVDSLRVGATSAFDLTACAIPLGELQQAGLDAEGLLGLNFLKSFRVTFDFETNTMHLDRP